MSKKLLALMLSVFLGASLIAQTSGKISGVISDKSSGDPLPGVNISVVNSTLGASTDVDGFYVILNVPVGSHDVQIEYIGYKQVNVKGLRVFVDNTTELSRALEEAVNEGDVEEVIAQRVLIRKNETNSRQIKTSEEIKNLPVTSVTGIVAVTAGVVNREGSSSVNIRGGRTEETAFIVDGVNQNSSFDGGQRSRVNKNAIEEVTVQSGGFSAEFGGVMSGLVQTTTKSGSKNYTMILEASTDGFGDKEGDEFLGGKTNGFSDVNLAVGGPLIPGNDNHFFFISLDKFSLRDNASSFISNNKDAGTDAKSFVANYTANLTDQITLRIGGTADWIDSDLYSHARWYWGTAAHTQKSETRNFSGNIRLTHVIDKNTYYTVRANQLLYQNKTSDNKLGDDWKAYGDKYRHEYKKTVDDFNGDEVAFGNDAIKYGRVTDYGTGADDPGTYTYDDHGTIVRPGNPDDSKRLIRMSAINNIWNGWGQSFELSRDFQFDVFHKFNNHQIKVGGGYKKDEIRTYGMAPEGLWTTDGANSVYNPDFNKYKARGGGFGYTVNGSWVDDENANYVNGGTFANPNPAKGGADAARTPERMWFYAGDELVYDDLILNIGFRYDYFNSNWINFKDFYNPTRKNIEASTGLEEAGFKFDETDYKDSEAFNEIQPRLGFAFPVDENTKFAANFSRMAQMPNGNRIYSTMKTLYDALDSEGSTINNPNLRPQTSLNYEVSISHQISSDIAITARTYYREITDLVSIQRVNSTQANFGNFHYFTYTNIDYSDTKGLEIGIESRRINNLRFFGNYTFSSALGTGSSAAANSRTVRDDSQEVVRFEQTLEQDVPHQLNLNVDYRFFEGEGPTVGGMKIFEHMGVNMLYNYQSGRPYTSRGTVNSFREIQTRFAEIDSKVNGKRKPSISSLDLRIDKSFFTNISSQRVEFNVFLDIQNLLNKENILFVYRNTGDAYDDGWLADSRSLSDNETDSDYKRDAYRYLLSDPGNFGKPRTVKLGLRVEF
jgi:outer membrane receptor protein involved in Fe transport